MITLPSNTMWVTPKLGVAVIPGDRCECVGAHEQGRCMASWPEMAGEVRYRPQEWVQYDKPCETPNGCVLGHTRKAMECPACSGSADRAWWKWYKTRTQSADVRQRVSDWLDGRLASSPDCRDGRQVWEVRWFCPACYAPEANPIGPHCAFGSGSGRASLQVVPVVLSDDDHEHADFVEVWQNGMTYLFPNDEILGVLDPLPVPGRDWVLVVRSAA